MAEKVDWAAKSQQLAEKINWTALIAHWRATEERNHGLMVMYEAFSQLTQGDLLGFHLLLYKSQLHYKAAAKYEECAAV